MPENAGTVERSLAWVERSRQPDADLVKLRQRRHRLREMVRPREPARSTDPWEIAAAGLHDLRSFIRTQTRVNPWPKRCAVWPGDRTTSETPVPAAF